MRAWGPVAAIIFAIIMAIVAGIRLDATAAAMIVGMVVGVVLTTIIFLLLFALMAAHNWRVREAEQKKNLYSRREVRHEASLARQSEPSAVIVLRPEHEDGPFWVA